MEFPERDVVQIPSVINSSIVNIPNAPYGYSPDKLNNASAPIPTYKDDSNDHCNILPPAPRSQIYPPKCGSFKQPFKKKELYLTYSPDQETSGFTQGPPDNSNWVRGNNFSVNKNISNDHLHKKEINVGKVFQTNTLYVADSPFYKNSNLTSLSTKTDKWNMTYPHMKEYDNSGQPFFYDDPSHNPTFYIGPDKNGVKVIEGFDLTNFENGSKQMKIFILTLIVIFGFLFMVSLRKK